MVLKEIRFKKRISQWELSRIAGVHQSRISLVENSFPARELEKKKIAAALGVAVNSIDWPK